MNGTLSTHQSQMCWKQLMTTNDPMGASAIEFQVCLDILDDGFSRSGPLRLISGVCCTGECANGVVLDPRGVRFKLPLPLLASHSWLRPLGQVEQVWRVDDTLQFTARMCDARFAWNEHVWPIVEANGVSLYATDLTGTRNFGSWQLHEVSLVTTPVQPDARILKAWERARVVHVDDRASETVFYDARVYP
jgi:hypothetical protein